MKKVTLLFYIVFLCLGTAYSQVIYTDLNPDSTINMGVGAGGFLTTQGTGDSGIDFNGDGTAEYTFGWYHSPAIPGLTSSTWYLYFNHTNNKIATYTDLSQGVALLYTDTITLGTNIGSGNTWNNPMASAGVTLVDDKVPNIFNQDGYISCEFDLNGNTHYGWMRCSVVEFFDGMDSIVTLTVKDFAYESTPNTAINAGEKGTTAAILVNSITVQGQGGTSTINTPSGTLQMETIILPANATNNSVTWSLTNGTGMATINANGLLSAVSDGTVTITATANDGSNISGSTTITISNQVTAVDKLADDLNIKIYPNPVSDLLTIVLNSLDKTELVRIVRIDGSVLKTISSPKGQVLTIDVAEFSKGTYFVELIRKEQIVLTKRIIVQ